LMGKPKPTGITPTMFTFSPSIRTEWPMIPGSPPKVLLQINFLPQSVVA
jgi:hypothetical protein